MSGTGTGTGTGKGIQCFDACTRVSAMDVFAGRRRRLLEAIQGVAIFFAAPVTVRNNDVQHEYRQDSDLFYLTGLGEPEAVLVLAPAHPKYKQILFVRPRDPEREIWDGARA